MSIPRSIRLAGVVNPETGWGRRDETWSFMQAMTALGGPAWFNLGDRDLATHVDRTHRLRSGATLTDITAHLAGKLGVAARVLPMADEPVRTVVETDAGTLAFQEYFVRDQCRPVVRSIRYDGAAAARVTPQVMQALSAPDLAGVIICPSNPWLSIDPILAVPGMRDAMRASGAPVIAVTPIVGGKALKGPTAKIMAELGIAPDARSIASHYGDLIDGFVLDTQDAQSIDAMPRPAHGHEHRDANARRQGGSRPALPGILRSDRAGARDRPPSSKKRGRAHEPCRNMGNRSGQVARAGEAAPRGASCRWRRGAGSCWSCWRTCSRRSGMSNDWSPCWS